MKTSAIVLCAGKGTRMKSEIPKVLHPLLGRSLAAWPIEIAYQLGIESVLAVVGHQAVRVEEKLYQKFPKLLFANQKEQNGTGHAVSVGLDALNRAGQRPEHILVLYGDTPLLRAEVLQPLLERHKETNSALTLMTSLTDTPTGYGRIIRENGKIVENVEEKDTTPDQKMIREVNPGIYCFAADFLEAEINNLSTDNAQGEFYLTDLIAKAAELDRLEDLHIDFVDTLGINDRKQLARARRVLRHRILDTWMENGVTIFDPESTTIEATVELEKDVVLHPGVTLSGNTSVATGVEIHTGCQLFDTTVKEGATLLPYSVCESAFVDKNAQIGPFGRLRPEAHIGIGAKIGNFVEVKKARFGEGAKANHLAYIGDAEVGAGSNIGAGTITCNYDGIGKNKTTLGERVFVGSNSTLVAPLEIDNDAYIAASSCISNKVPSDAMAIARARQVTKEGYAEKIRTRNLERKNKS